MHIANVHNSSLPDVAPPPPPPLALLIIQTLMNVPLGYTVISVMRMLIVTIQLVASHVSALLDCLEMEKFVEVKVYYVIFICITLFLLLYTAGISPLIDVNNTIIIGMFKSVLPLNFM